MLRTNIGRLRIVGFLEGISYLVLLGICMPLKYIGDIPESTFFVGMVHGILFIIYCVLVVVVMVKYKWSLMKTFWALLASVLPFGTFVADVRIFRQQKS
ncbi:MAG: hypothetical protein COA57_15485 [Flavobacteriales bacterium]|nr:MAG: hypothetical protein COA57_15485 [Flavobacteriales bacterium]